MILFLTGLVSLLLAALSLGPSFAHALEASPRLRIWSPELWREATVFNRQFTLFLFVGAPLDVAAIVGAVLLAYVLFGTSPGFQLAFAGALLLACALVAWFTIVSPANGVLATWKPGPIPADFNAVRLRWEIGHIVVAVLKTFGFVAISAAVLAPRLIGAV